MFDRCFRCGQQGHVRADCPQRKKLPAASATPAATTGWKPPAPPADLHRYPADHYLHYPCPWCGAGVRALCRNVGTKRERGPHFARLDTMPIRIDTY